MNIAFLLSVFISVLLSLSPADNELMLIGQFSIYVDANSYKEGELDMTWESKFDKDVYRNDCSVLFDLYQMRGEICSPEEYLYIQKRLEEYEMREVIKATPNINKI